MKFSEVYDPKGLCKDVAEVGRWGNGDVELFFESLAQIDDVMAIIEQSYNKQVYFPQKLAGKKEKEEEGHNEHVLDDEDKVAVQILLD